MTASSSLQPSPWEIEYWPWLSQEDGEIPNFRVTDANGDAVCETNENLPAEVQERAATLIAAAPELLNALEYFFNIMHDYPSSVRKGYVKQAMERARDAIAAAKGERA